MSHIHPTAVIAAGAKIDPSAHIGPYCVIGDKVTIAENVSLVAHVVIDGRTSIGAGTIIYPFASLGSPPQDLKFKGEDTQLIIGADCRIREHVTMNPGTLGGGAITQVGDKCLLMMSSHVAHDCRLGSNVILANNVALAGHVHVGDFAIIGGNSAVHQFVHIGHHAMIGGMSGVENDVIPYGMVMGERAHLAGLNLVGLERRGFSREAIRDLRTAYRLLFAPEGTMSERLEDVAQKHAASELVQQVISFIRNKRERALCQPRVEHAA